MKAKSASVRGTAVTIALFALAAVLLIFSTVGSSRAALTYFSETYGAEVSMYQIGVSLVENGRLISNRDYTGADDNWYENTGWLLSGMLSETNNELQLDYPYLEKLSVTNSGDIDEYVRVSIYRYWTDTNPYDPNWELTGRKLTNLSPSYIDLELVTGNGWIRDPNTPATAERTVLYYDHVLGIGESTDLFAETLTIHASEEDGLMPGMHLTATNTYEEDGIITTTWDYDGVYFVLRVVVDAVQTHNAEAAIQSAWGVDMNAIGIRRP